MLKRSRIILLTAALMVSLAGVWGSVAAALDVPKAPPLDRPIIDTTGTLSAEQIDAIAKRINHSRATKNIQMAILMVPSLEGEALESYSLEVARTWGVGEKDKNNGVLLFIAKDDRRVRIEVGRGQEGDITDAESGRVIRNTIAPAFRENDYYGGIARATSQLLAAAAGDASAIPEDTQANQATPGIGEALFWIVFLAFPFFSWLGSILARSKSWWAGGVLGGIGGLLLIALAGIALWSLASLAILALLGLIFDYNVSKNYKKSLREHHSPSWWAGGGFGGGFGGGGGGGSFGGGGFGGGGSSGSW